MATTLPSERLSERRFPRVGRRLVCLQAHRRLVALLTGISILGVFFIDLVVPHLPIAGFYVIPVLLAAIALRERVAVLVTLLCTALTLVVVQRQEGISVESLLFVAFGLLAAGGLIALARLFNQVERISGRALLRAQLAEATASIIELSGGRADLDELLHFAVERIGEQMGAESGLLLLLREGEWRGVAGFGMPATAYEVSLPFAELPLAVEALAADRAIVAGAASNGLPHGRGDAELLGFKNVIVLPLRAFAAEVGAIILNRGAQPSPLSGEQLRFAESVAGHAAVAIENARLMSELENKRRDLSLVVESSLSFASSLELRDVLRAVATRLVEVLGVAECDVSVLDDDQSSLRVVASYGSAEGDLAGRVFPLEDYHATREALVSGRPVTVGRSDDSRLSEKERRVLREHGHTCQLIVPLKAQDRVIGAAELYANDAGRRFTAEEVDLAVAIAQFAALAIWNASLYRQAERSAARMSLVNAANVEFSSTLEPQGVLASIAQRLCAVTDTPICEVFLLQDAEHFTCAASVRYGEPDQRWGGESYRLDEWSATRLVVETRAPMVITDADDPRLGPTSRAWLKRYGERSVLIVPLVAKERVIGTVELVEDRRERTFTAEEVETAEAISRVAALALDNAQLYEAERVARERLEGLTGELRALQEVSLSLNRLLDPQAILDEVIGAGALLLNAPLAAAVSRAGQALRLEASHLPERVGEEDGGATVTEQWLDGLPELLRDYAGGAHGLRRAPGRLLLVPLASDRLRQGGALVFARLPEQPEFTDEDESIALTLGAHLNVSLDRSIAYQREHEFADTFQTALLVKPPFMPGIDVGVSYRPADEAFRVGGDFYDLVKLGEGRLMVVLGDVCGKGLGAAAHSAMVRYMLRAYAAESSPGESLSRLNAALISEEADAPFTTLVVAYFDVVRHTFEYAVAGHPRPLVLCGGQEFPIATEGSLPVGILNSFYPTNRAVLPEGSTVVFYTDGVTEARRGQRMFGQRRLLQSAREGLSLSPRAAAEHVVERVKRYARGLRDDVAVVVVRLP